MENGNQQVVHEDIDEEEVVEETSFNFEESKEPDTNYSDNFQEPPTKRTKLNYFKQEINGVP